MDKWSQIVHHWPLIGLVVQRIKAVSTTTKLIDSVIIIVATSIISGGGATFFTAKWNAKEIDDLKTLITQYHDDQKDAMDEVKQTIERMRRDLYEPKRNYGS